MSDKKPTPSPENSAANEVDVRCLVRPAWMTGNPECDWIEDSRHENGGYFNKCMQCKDDFIGHKRRLICRKCHYKNKAVWDAMSDKEKADWLENRDAEIKDYYRTNSKRCHGEAVDIRES